MDSSGTEHGECRKRDHDRALRFRPLARALIAGALLALVIPITAGGSRGEASQWPAPNLEDVPGTIRAAFARRSYAPRDGAVLRVFAESRPFHVQIFRVGLERLRPRRDDLLAGTPVSVRRKVVPRRGGELRLRLEIGRWPSGFYFARLSRANGELGFAPFVLRPERTGESRVLIVLPSHTWQAYNFRDIDRNGVGDTWYASPTVHVVDLSRPYLRRGVPPHFRGYDRAFIRWVAQTGKRADFIADDDLESVASGDDLIRMYDLVVFPGHEEYISPHAYDVVLRFRDLGGNLAFLSANTFYYRVQRHGDSLSGRDPWDELGRPAAALTGSEYVGSWKRTYKNRAYVVTDTDKAQWLFAGTGLESGDSFGRFGIEVDATSSRSPRRTVVLARIPSIFGKGRPAEMTYYRTTRGAKVFSAGALNFGGSVGWPPMSRLMENLWRELSVP